MADGDHEREQLAVGEDRLEQRVLGHVQATPVGVVMDDDIAFLDLSIGISSAQVLMSNGIPPIWAGQNSATETISPSVSAMAQVKSSPSLKIVE